MVLLSSKSRLDSTISPFLMMTKHEREEKHKEAKNIMKESIEGQYPYILSCISSSFLSPPFFCNICTVLSPSPPFCQFIEKGVAWQIITYALKSFRDLNTESHAQSLKRRFSYLDKSHSCIPYYQALIIDHKNIYHNP